MEKYNISPPNKPPFENSIPYFKIEVEDQEKIEIIKEKIGQLQSVSKVTVYDHEVYGHDKKTINVYPVRPDNMDGMKKDITDLLSTIPE